VADDDVILVAMNPSQRRAFAEWIATFDCTMGRMPPTDDEVLNGALPVYVITPIVPGFDRG
jgi:hypothetical protein